ncbi:MAG: UPF0182 family protein [Deltaproteobacteria bacterium]|nr:UPF0182 family protein [Deltaproteobacteria bacterium]
MPRLSLIVGALAVVIAIALFGLGSGFFVDALWFRQLGVLVVFRTALVAKLACFTLAFAACYAVVAAVGLAAVRSTRRAGVVQVVFRRTGNGPATLPELIAPVTDRLPWRAMVLAAAAVLAVLVAVAQAASWQDYLLWLYGGEFGVKDPYFDLDVGFFLFALPAYQTLVGGAMAIVVLAGLLAAVVFWLRGMLDFRRPGQLMPPAARRLLSLVLALFLLVKAAGYWIGRYELLLESYGAVFGAGYTVTHVKLPLQWILVAAALVGAGLAAANLRAPGWRLPVAAVVVVFGVAMASAILPDVFQRLRVRPDELRLERPYLEKNIAMTRRAYGLEAIQPRPFPSAQTLDDAALARNQATFANIRLWDPQPLLDSYRQLQLIRLYYDFHDVDVDRYELAGGRRQVMLAAREITPSLLPPNARTWVNQRLQFTHGFGVVMSPVTEIEGEGLPGFFVKDIPPRSPVGLELSEPRIYFGEKTDDYVIVNAAAEEFDYPKGEQNVSNSYAGKDGVELGSRLRRAVFAWSFRDVNLLISGNLRAESRILFRRSIAERISTIAPFLLLDHDPYVVVSRGRLYWIQDAYTTAETFPYSEPVRGLGLNYIRNSVKVVVDAYDGTVTFYAIDEKEPVLTTYARIFPGLFRPFAEMPGDLRRHVRYPEDLFLVQAEIYRTYHMTNPDVFYNKEDLWSLPTENAGGARSAVEPYYVIMKLPGGAREEFILMQPMTPSNRSNMVAWLAARCDPPEYGELVEYEFPKERLIYGPQQIEARIDQDTTISQQLSLWNQRGSKVIRGNLLVIPVEDSLVYVEPLYLRSDQGQIPELKRVIVAYGDRLAMEPTLEAALAAVFKPGAAPPRMIEPATTAPPKMAAATTARAHYRAALDALRAGDWSGFGREMDALDKALEQ